MNSLSPIPRHAPRTGKVSGRLSPATHIARAAACHIRARLTKSLLDRTLYQLYEDDEVTVILLRAATTPAMLSAPGWAQEIAQRAVLDLIREIAPLSAGASLLARGILASLDNYGSITIPSYAVKPGDAGNFVGEGSPIPVFNVNFGGPTLAPRKVAIITTYTAEMASSSNLETVVRTLLAQAAAITLDKYLFDNVAGDTVRPPGLLNGVTPITPTAGSGQAAMVGDVGSLIAALANGGGGMDPVLVGSAAQATRLSLLAPPKFDIPVLSTCMLADKTLVAVESSALVSGFMPIPEFDVATETAIQQETQPGTLMAGPTRSMFQTQSFALKMILRCAWGIRAPGMVAVVTGTNW